MGKNTSFSLDDHHRAFIEQEVASGRYRSASDVVRSALRLLEDRETQLRALRQALVTGEQHGESKPFDFDEFVARKRGGNPSPPMSLYVLSPAAHADLEQIWDYTCERWDDDQAEEYVREIQRANRSGRGQSDDRTSLRRSPARITDARGRVAHTVLPDRPQRRDRCGAHTSPTDGC